MMGKEQELPVGCKMRAHSRYASDDDCASCHRGEGEVCPEYKAMAEASMAAKRAEHAIRRSSDEQAEVVGWRGKYRTEERWKLFDHPYRLDAIAVALGEYQLEPLYASPVSGVTEEMVAAAMTAYTAEPSNNMRDMMRAALTAALGVGDEGMGEATDACPVCAVAFKPDDLCQTDIEMGPCHAACLEGSPLVNLETGDPLPDGSKWPTPYRYDSLLPTPPIQGDAK